MCVVVCWCGSGAKRFVVNVISACVEHKLCMGGASVAAFLQAARGWSGCVYIACSWVQTHLETHTCCLLAIISRGYQLYAYHTCTCVIL